MSDGFDLESVAAIVPEDEMDAIRSRAAGLMNQMLDVAERTLRHGTPTVQQALIGKVLPAFLREANTSTAGDGLDELRAQQDAMNLMIRDGLAATPARSIEVHSTAQASAIEALEVDEAPEDSTAPSTQPSTPARLPRPVPPREKPRSVRRGVARGHG